MQEKRNKIDKSPFDQRKWRQLWRLGKELICTKIMVKIQFIIIKEIHVTYVPACPLCRSNGTPYLRNMGLRRKHSICNVLQQQSETNIKDNTNQIKMWSLNFEAYEVWMGDCDYWCWLCVPHSLRLHSTA